MLIHSEDNDNIDNGTYFRLVILAFRE